MKRELLTMLLLGAVATAQALGAEPAERATRAQEAQRREPALEGGPTTSAPRPEPVLEGGPTTGAPRPVPIRDDADQVECMLPAPYWSYWDRAKLASQAQGGCGRPGTSPNLMFVVDNKDALARVWAERVPRRFLMRGKGDLEAYVNAFVSAIEKQARGPLREVESAYAEQDGMIVHRFAFTMPVGGGAGGCAAQRAPAGEPADARYAFAQYFVRPKDGEALEFKLFCAAPADAYAKLKPEFDYILGSFRYTGPAAEAFFVPDAPASKVPTAKDAARDAGTGGGGGANYTMLLVLGLIIVIWVLMRRRRTTPAA